MLKVENLHVRFNTGTPNEVYSLRGVSFSMDEGSFCVVIGSNGSGKSTLMNAIAGAFRADSGSIKLDGLEISSWPEYRRAAFIGRVFQNPFSGTAPHMTVAENLALASRRGMSRGLSPLISRKGAAAFRDSVKDLGMGLEDRMQNEIGSLSGGQRQALTLLMATWIRPRLLLLDEHTAALDPKTADKVIELTRTIVSRERLATLMVTHSMHQAVNLGDRLIMMHKGEIVEDISAAAKKRITPEHLLAKFEELRRMDQLDYNTAEMLRRRYV